MIRSSINRHAGVRGPRLFPDRGSRLFRSARKAVQCSAARVQRGRAAGVRRVPEVHRGRTAARPGGGCGGRKCVGVLLPARVPRGVCAVVRPRRTGRRHRVRGVHGQPNGTGRVPVTGRPLRKR